MKFLFDPNQQYQLDAVKSVVNIFAGQTPPTTTADLFTKQTVLPEFDKGVQTELLDLNIVPNKPVELDASVVAKNVFDVQASNKLTKSNFITKPVSKNSQMFTEELQDSTDFTVEMETGTGKTYVYLRTIFELNARYGWTKFIIVVPRIAIKEGVVKSFAQMKEHFAELYGAPKVNFTQWNSKKRGIGKQFATSSNIDIMVLNIDSFTRSNTIFNSDSDWGKPLAYIAQTNPILVLDEPQNMETDKRRSAIESLNPLFSLRYSATHKEIKNLVYSLNPVQAYNQGLVKQIEVDSVLSDSGDNKRLLAISHGSKNKLIAKIELDSSDKAGIQKRAFNLGVGDELSDYAKRDVYDGLVIDTIDAENSFVQFTNGEILSLGVANAEERLSIMKTQIDQTVRNHFIKQKQLKDQCIKVLSLFFIDRVANYINGGFLAQLFEESYNKYASWPQYKDLIPFNAKQVHGGYFSVDKKGNALDSKDSADGAVANDDATLSAYDKILKQKERLISFDEPLSFLFSHTALREGWDNPNVFQICTLNETVSVMKKRQEIGRGLRLAVDQAGARNFDRKVNVLTVVANESYDEFASKLQQEIEQDTGVVFAKSNIKPSKSEPVKLKVHKDLSKSTDFVELWNRISAKTTYTVEFEEEDLIELASEKLADAHIEKPRVKVLKSAIEMNDTYVKASQVNEAVGEKVEEKINFDLLKLVQGQTKLKRTAIFSIIKKSGVGAKFISSPHHFADALINAISEAKQQLLVDGISYKRLNDSWAISLFKDEEIERAMRDVYEPQNIEKTALNYVPIDSGIEQAYAQELDNSPDVKFYFKLPRGFKITTPLGNYRPDWAVVFEQDVKIYFVSETKGVDSTNDFALKPAELMKIKYSRKHFEKLGSQVGFIAPTSSYKDTISKI